MSETAAPIVLSWAPKLPSFATTSSGSSKSDQAPKPSTAQGSLWKPPSELVDGLFVPPRDPRQLNKLARKSVKDTSGKGWFDMPAPTITPELKKDLEILQLWTRSGRTSPAEMPVQAAAAPVVEVPEVAVALAVEVVAALVEDQKAEAVPPVDEVPEVGGVGFVGAGGAMRTAALALAIGMRRLPVGDLCYDLRHVIDPKRHFKRAGKSKALPKYFQVGTVVEPASEFYSSRLKNRERKATLVDELLSDQSLKSYRMRKVCEIQEIRTPGGNQKWKNKGKKTLKRAKDRRK